MASSFPPPPVTTIDWSNVGFRVREVNGHIETHFSKQTNEWTTPKFIVDPYLRLHGMAPAINYGQQCFEGMKAFRAPPSKDGPDTINIFRPQQNAERLNHSASYVSIPDVPIDLFKKCVHLAVSLNADFVPPHETGAAMYIRPLLFGSSAQLGLTAPEEYTFVVYVLPTGTYHGVHPVDALVLEEFDRAAPEGTGTAKLGGNYAPVMRWSDKARKDGYDITLHLDSATRTEIDEFSTSGFVGIHGSPDKEGGCTIVVPDSRAVIKSVTSSSICEIAKSWGWKVEKRPIKYEELPSFTEIAAAGTAAALVPIKSITMRSKNDKFSYLDGSDEPGPAVNKLIKQLQDIQRGIVKDTFGWTSPVREYKQDEYEREGSEVASKGKEINGNGKAVGQLE